MNGNVRLGANEVQDVEEMIVDQDDGALPTPRPANSHAAVSQQSASHAGRGSLPSREEFMDPNNTQGLLPLTDPRSREYPSVQALHTARASPHGEENCPISFSDMADLDDVVVTVACGHIFHRTCLLTWLSTEVSIHACPFCRQDIFALPADFNDSDDDPYAGPDDSSDEEPGQDPNHRSILALALAMIRDRIRLYERALREPSFRDDPLFRELRIPNAAALSEEQMASRIHAEIRRLHLRIRGAGRDLRAMRPGGPPVGRRRDVNMLRWNTHIALILIGEPE